MVYTHLYLFTTKRVGRQARDSPSLAACRNLPM